MALLQQLPFSFVQPEQDPAPTTNTLQKGDWMPSDQKTLPSPPLMITLRMKVPSGCGTRWLFKEVRWGAPHAT